jgi:parallel beta-helix repeat protein
MRLSRSRPPAARRCRPAVEMLEGRLLLSTSHHPVFLVPAGGSIQAVVNAAPAGSLIVIAPGTYTETVTITRPNLTLVGVSGPGGGVVLSNPGQAHDGIDVAPLGHGVTLENFTVQGFTDNGISLTGVQNFEVNGVTARDNGDYGIFPVLSSHGTIEHCVATGHRDTGIYVGQSADVLVRGNLSFGNVNGIEIENSRRVRAVGNAAFDNTAGVLVDLLPGLIVATARDNVVQGNVVLNNNRPNFAVPGDVEAAVPAGSGILVFGTTATMVTNNTVLGNQFAGIALASLVLLAERAGVPSSALAGLPLDPTNTHVRDNHVLGNGTKSPDPSLPAADLLWDGSGHGNCWSGNAFGTSFPAHLPACH